jgi:hypothetical protein
MDHDPMRAVCEADDVHGFPEVVPQGWMLVPVEPTKEMIEASGWALSKLPPERHMAMQLCGRDELRNYKALIRYRAMVAAAPKSPGVQS